MVSSKFIIGSLLIIIIVGGVWIFGSFSQNPINTAGVISNLDEDEQIAGIKENVVEITSSGFSPKELVISKGEAVTWINRDTEEHWPASAIHPTHTVYPGSDVNKCGTAEQENIFDSCHGLAQGESWTFTFNEVGSWAYHDHIVSGLFGKIIVE